MFYNLFLFSYSWCPQVSTNQYLMQINKTNWLHQCCQFLLSQITHVPILNINFSIPSLKFLIYSNKKKFSHCHVNVIHMLIIALCIHFSITACYPYLTCSSVCNYSHILCILVTQCFVAICTKLHSCIWLGNCVFDSKHLCNALLLTCSISYFVFICGFMER
jgi:hypothetical protein